MAIKSGKAPAAKKSPAAAAKKPQAAPAATAAKKTRTAPAAKPPEVSLGDLARGILAREIRAKVSDVRRLAEAVAELLDKPIKKKKAGGGKKKDKRKLAKIPGQKAKK